MHASSVFQPSPKLHRFRQRDRDTGSSRQDVLTSSLSQLIPRNVDVNGTAHVTVTIEEAQKQSQARSLTNRVN